MRGTGSWHHQNETQYTTHVKVKLQKCKAMIFCSELGPEGTWVQNETGHAPLGGLLHIILSVAHGPVASGCCGHSVPTVTRRVLPFKRKRHLELCAGNFYSHMNILLMLLQIIFVAMSSLSCVRLFLRPHGLQPTRLLYPWDFPGKNTGVGWHFFLQGIFLTQGLNCCLQHWQADSLPLSHLGSPSFQLAGTNTAGTVSA